MNIKRIAVVGLGVLFWVSQAMASQWDDQITQWKKESTNLKAEQIPQLEDAAKNGDARATYLLYLEIYEERFSYAKRNSANQIGVLAQKIANTDNPIGMNMLCYLYWGRGGLTEDLVQRLKWCKKGAEAGIAEVMIPLAESYRDGDGTIKNSALATEWYTKAAKLGKSKAMYALGEMYQSGNGVISDSVQALYWYRKAAEAGYVKGMTNLGFMLMNGLGTSKDELQAFNWFSRAADAGSAQSMLNLADMWLKGVGVQKNQSQALIWLRKSAEAGNALAMRNLGAIYRDGSIDAQKNGAEAIVWFRKAAEANNVTAMHDLASAYMFGGYVPKDPAQALYWARQGSDLNHTESVALLAGIYDLGYGVVKDDVFAATLYLKAANAGHIESMNNVGVCFILGRGVVKNVAEALVWFRKAAEKGSKEGMSSLGSSFQFGDGVSKDKNKAASWYAKALKVIDIDYISWGKVRVGDDIARRNLDAMLAAGEITDPEVLREVRALSKPAPKAEWVQAPQTTSEEEVTFKVNVVDGGGGIGDVSFKLNGVALNVAQGRNAAVIELANTNVRTFKFRLPPGKHDVEVVAYNAENLINWTSLKSTVTSTFKPIRKPQLHAVIVGINDYENDKLKLRFATNDATEVAKVLNTSGEKLYDQVHVKLLNTRSSTGKTAILQAIKEAASKAQTEDVFIFYVAGHGQNFGDNGYHMLTADVSVMTDKAIQERSISAQELQRAIYNVPSGKKVVLLDTCQSGGGLDASKLMSARGGMDNLDMVKDMNRKSGAIVLAAAESKEDAMEGYQGHGVFTFALLEALQGKADTKGDGFVSTFQLQEYVSDRTYQLAQLAFNGKKQSPYTDGKNGFPLLKWK